jgi:hypothetical protein
MALETSGQISIREHRLLGVRPRSPIGTNLWDLRGQDHVIHCIRFIHSFWSVRAKALQLGLFGKTAFPMDRSYYFSMGR